MKDFGFWSDAEQQGGEWPHERWPNFKPLELCCKYSGALMVDEIALDNLQALRTRIGVPFHITSAYRTEAGHKKIYEKIGKPAPSNSLHLQARAFDIRAETQYLRERLLWLARDYGFTRAGIADTFIHLDNGTPQEGYTVTMWTYS